MATTVLPNLLTISELSRVDRSVADNLMDIDKSFGPDAQHVLDFILFISKKLNQNLFGYTRFTIKEYSNFTGINPVNLCAQHPDIVRSKIKAPVIEGHRFESVFDYTLYRMLRENIIFSKIISYRDGGEMMNLENFPILKGINIQRANLGIARKIYEVRLSDVILEGFVKRYYTLNTNWLANIGKGKGGHSRKKIYIWINKIFHIYTSEGKNDTPIYPVDYVADLAGVRYMKDPDEKGQLQEKEPKHKKEAVKNILEAIFKSISKDLLKLHFSFSYEFVKGNINNRFEEDYFVKFSFTSNLTQSSIEKLKFDHNFKFTLLVELRKVFDALYPKAKLNLIPHLENEKDAFQRWLNNSSANPSEKVEQIKAVYWKVNGWNKTKVLKDTEALKLIQDGFLEYTDVN